MTPASSANDVPVADIRAMTCSAVRMPSPVEAWSVMTTSALLTAEDKTGRHHRLEHVTVSDRGLYDPRSTVLHRVFEAEVGHDRGDDGVLGQAP